MNQQNQQSRRLRLDFYSTAVLMSRWEDDGRVTIYPVSVHDVVSACTNVELSSGLLPPDTLFWRQRANQAILGIYVPARRWRVQTEDHRYHVPMPPFVFVGSGTSYQIFAVKKRPQTEHDWLYHAPCPNVHPPGDICRGNTPFPVCSPQNIQTALALFMEGSYFNVDLSQGKCRRHPDDVRQLWTEVERRKCFPVSELIDCRKVLRDLL